jgi:hypothetical protein
VIVYDCEIVRAIPPEDPTDMLKDIEYCAGWHDFENMGISVIGAYDYEQDRYRIFCEDNPEQFQELVDQADVVVSFNGLVFDNRLVEANGLSVPDEKTYDLLVEIWRAAGLGPRYEYPTHSGFSLDKTVQANFPGEAKTGRGDLAPVLWQRGQRGRVIDYCLQDNRLTKMLLDRVMRDGTLVNPKNPDELLVMRQPL